MTEPRSDNEDSTLDDDTTLSKGATRPDRRPGAASIESVPERFGPYRVVQKLGEGGMGSVFLAEQTEPVSRRVALKVMRSPFADREGRLRFETERQAMARLQHPNVAQIFEAGATAEGHPYFVMEYVAGEPITKYCDAQRLSIEERLEVFGDVCAGVRHAHQKGIIHRDLKPSNILVAEIGERLVPKIIDFGIAKTLDQPLVGDGLATGDRLIGTPAYLSPEAADVGEEGADIDTRSDVYSLGVLLYELLVGHRPFDDQSVSILQTLRRIVVEEPVRPSQRWAELDAAARAAIAARRRIEPGPLERRLREDLDWIVLKAIAKDRQDRYGSAAELAADIHRFLRHEPVEAGPPSPVYRLRKFVRRRLGTAVSATLVGLAVAAGLVGRTLEANRANRAAAAAIEAREDTERALARAEQARAETAEVSDFLASLFTVSDPGEAMGNTVTARELLDAGAEKIRAGFAGQPLARARFMQTIGDVYRKLGLYDSARQLFEEALEIRESELPADHADVAESLNGLAALHAQLGRIREAEPLFEKVLAIREKAFGADSFAVAMSLNNLANLYSDLGKRDEAERLFLRSVAIVERHEGPPAQDLLVALNNLAALYWDQGRFEEAEPLLRKFLAYQRTAHGPAHPHVAVALENLADVRASLGAADEAERLYREALAILEKVLGPDHPEVAYCLSNLAALLASQGRAAEAEPLFRRAQAIQEEKLPEDHPERRATAEGLDELLRSAAER